MNACTKIFRLMVKKTDSASGRAAMVAILFVVCLAISFLTRTAAAAPVEEHKSTEVVELRLDG